MKGIPVIATSIERVLQIQTPGNQYPTLSINQRLELPRVLDPPPRVAGITVRTTEEKWAAAVSSHGSICKFPCLNSRSVYSLAGYILEMRCIFEFVSCCLAVKNHMETAAPPYGEDMRSLTPETARIYRRRRRGAAKSSSAAAAAIADWKPSLGTISEDKVVVVLMEREKSDDPTAESQRSVKRKSGSGDVRVHDRNNSNVFGRSQGAVPVLIPAFSPTPFLF